MWQNGMFWVRFLIMVYGRNILVDRPGMSAVQEKKSSRITIWFSHASKTIIKLLDVIVYGAKEPWKESTNVQESPVK